MDILVNTLDDKCPDVKKISAVLVVRLTDHHKKVLRLKGSSLAGPLARNISHRQSGVRAVTVTALGQLLLTTDGAVFESLASHLAQRVFDPSPQVRTYIQHSHWSSSYNTALSLVESFRVLKYERTSSSSSLILYGIRIVGFMHGKVLLKTNENVGYISSGETETGGEPRLTGGGDA